MKIDLHESRIVLICMIFSFFTTAIAYFQYEIGIVWSVVLWLASYIFFYIDTMLLVPVNIEIINKKLVLFYYNGRSIEYKLNNFHKANYAPIVWLFWIRIYFENRNFIEIVPPVFYTKKQAEQLLIYLHKSKG